MIHDGVSVGIEEELYLSRVVIFLNRTPGGIDDVSSGILGWNSQKVAATSRERKRLHRWHIARQPRTYTYIPTGYVRFHSVWLFFAVRARSASLRHCVSLTLSSLFLPIPPPFPHTDLTRTHTRSRYKMLVIVRHVVGVRGEEFNLELDLYFSGP